MPKKSRTLRITCRCLVLALATCLAAANALADEPASETEKGSLPAWDVSFAAGSALHFYSFTRPPAYDGDAASSDSSISAVTLLGISGSLSVDLGTAVLLGTGTVSFASPATEELTGGALFGWRTWRHYETSRPVGSMMATETYLNRYVPMVLGPYVGGGFYASGGFKTRELGGVVANVSDLQMPLLEAGFGCWSDIGVVASAVVAPGYSTGGRLRFHMSTFDKGVLGVHLGVNALVLPGAVMHFAATLGLGGGTKVEN